MKRFLLLFASALFLLPICFAQKSDLVFSTKKGQPFYLLINGALQNEVAANNIKVTNVGGDQRNVTFIFEDPQFGFLDYNVPYVPGNETHFVARRTTELVWVMRMDGSYPKGTAPAPLTAQLEVAYINKAPMIEMPEPTNQPEIVVTDPDAVEINVTIDALADPLFPAGTQTTTTTTRTTVTTTGPASAYSPAVVTEVYEQPVQYVPGYTGPVGCPAPMDPTSFNVARNSVTSNSFSSTRLAVAKQITSQNCLTAAQVREMTRCFDFESGKLEYAKYAYGFTYDKANYFLVNDAFDFESSISALQKHIGVGY